MLDCASWPRRGRRSEECVRELAYLIIVRSRWHVVVVARRAPEGEDLPEEHVRESARFREEPREDAIRRRRAATSDETSENEQLLPRLADVTLPASVGLDAAQNCEHVLSDTRCAPNYRLMKFIWRLTMRIRRDTRALQ